MIVGTLGLYARTEPVYRQMPAEEVCARGGIGNVMEKIRMGRDVTVAYLGGSITEMNGWRNKTTAWLQATYPQVRFKEVAAAIGGTGSDLGVFRLQHDALSFNPDLLFVEFATNDGGRAPEEIWRNMEGIVRQTWRQNPRTDIVFAYTITVAFTNDYCRGLCNRSASAMEALADHYDIPSVNFGVRVAGLLKGGKLMMDAREIETAVPQASPEHDRLVRERLAADPRLLFSNDGVHPRDEGHELYKASVVAAFEKMKDLSAVDHGRKLAVPFVKDNLEEAKMVPIRETMLSGNWSKVPSDDGKQKTFGGRMGQIWTADRPGSTLHFKFRGSVAKLYDLLGPDGGQVTVAVDGKTKGLFPCFDSYCTYHRIATLDLFSSHDTCAVHEVTVILHPDQPDRKSVAFRLKEPDIELKSPKYQGTHVWASQLMLVGDAVE